MRDETDGKVSYFEVLKHFNEYKKTEKQIIMETYEQKIEIPFGAKDSELQGWTYTIPDGMEAEIKTGQIIVKKKKSQDEQIREASISYLNEIENNGIASINGFSIKEYITYLEKQKQSEWSEEDKHRCDDAIYFLETAKKHYADTSEIELTIAWLKSLRSQPKRKIYQAAKHDLAIRFMNYLDENRPEGKMSLSEGECGDIDKAFKENDWAKIMRYAEKYLIQSEQKRDGNKEDYHWEGLVQLLRDYQKTIDRSSNNMAYESVECYIEWIKSLRLSQKQERE